MSKAMFDPTFIATLFKPQPMYSQSNLRTIFDHLSKASIMRLNKESMAKLYDLMVMVFKYQLMLVKEARDLFNVTLTHLHLVETEILQETPVAKMVHNCKTQFYEAMKNLRPHHWESIRRAILTMFQDKHTRVSLLLQAKSQGQDGRFALPRTGSVPPNHCLPGSITYHTPSGPITETFGTHKFEAPESELEVVLEEPNTFLSELGENLYRKARQGHMPGVNVAAVMATPEPTPASLDERPARAAQQLADPEPAASDEANATALAGLNLLSQLVGSAADASDTTFKLRMFVEDEDDVEPIAALPSGPRTEMVRVQLASQAQGTNSRRRVLEIILHFLVLQTHLRPYKQSWRKTMQYLQPMATLLTTFLL
eukprot:TRINITY_DN4337_c0_g1_i1.p1 TRINITY_DN4337_c0_g1~~TRINITY_DN4337_c0_g1_i1.p1  ORF type:complete len:414 (+),score=78.97 TRINITY_DN4337_c0_g1_i1:138-1244(+)